VTESEPVRLQLESDGLAAELDVEALAADGDGAADAIRLPSELDPARWELARTLAASFDDGLLVALVALRPVGAGGHGEESVAAVVVREGDPKLVEEALLSVEYDAAGAPRRVGLEIYEAPDSLPLRIVGDRVDGAGDRTMLTMRVDGVIGRGQLAVVRPA
jgi:hypothetical protein